ncbi:Dynamin-binding protein [Hypsizygus marmoreus]|uniref:Dynamin-binding protein n=1 Tax=Hypsizygus marmoreus TaxID=39966 RepID=A0A369JUT6_HYPMA|nr:Dynamin-binding protein [Hypsizygus marmoreus]
MSSGFMALDITSNAPVTPRSRRVGMVIPPGGFSFEERDYPSSPPSPASPPLPVRSPLRPASRSISGSSTATNTTTMAAPSTARPQRPRRPATPPPLEIDDFASIVEDAIPLTFQMRRRSYVIDNILGIDSHAEDTSTLSSKALPLRPDSPTCLSIEDEATSSSSSSLAQQTPLTKRQHALHELLSSERAYASDLALIREVHIPLALGQSVPLNSSSSFSSPSPPPPPSSSSSSSRTLSVSSDSSAASLGPPMTQEDTRIIFSNIAELAIFSDRFCEALEVALGSNIEGGEGEDQVGALFLEIIPDLERPYKYYINKHSSALAHLQALPSTPALSAYLTHTQSVASNLSHAWDLASLLIKPVQRLLKYPLLLAAIIDETPDTHGDKVNLKLARLRMEEVARNVNEGRRRAEVVKEVLTSKKKAGVGVGVAASVNLTKMKSLRQSTKSSGSASAGVDANEEAARVAAMHAELKRVDVFAQQFARHVVEWSRSMHNVVLALRAWGSGFGKVIGLSPEQGLGSEAFDALMQLVEEQLVPLCNSLEAEINERMLKELAHLLMTMNQPLKLLASMNEQEPLHYHLLTMPVTPKNRPPASLLAASTNYLALRGQLASELPSYLVLLHKGLAVFVRRLGEIQAAFWGSVRDRWADLWDMLRVEGEMNAGGEETMRVWAARWADVDEIVGALNICQARKLYQEPALRATVQANILAGLEPQLSAQSGGASGKNAKATGVVNMLAALEPVHVSSPLPLARSSKTRPRGQSDASTTVSASRKNSTGSVRPSPGRKMSTDSFPSITSASTASATVKHSLSQKKKGDVFLEYVASLPAATPRSPTLSAIPRTKSMPLPPPETSATAERTMSYRSSASSRTLVGMEGEVQDISLDDDKDRGRTSRKPSLRRKLTDSLTLRPSSRGRSNGGREKGETFFDDFDVPASPPSVFAQQSHNHSKQQREHPQQREQREHQHQHTHRDSWVTKRAKYVCQVVHACKPPAAVSYFSFPFFTLVEGELYEVLQETGHPSMHPKLPLYVDDGEDCLLLCRDGLGDVGWALASFLAPVDGVSFS